MLEQDKINEYTQLLKECEKAKEEIRAMSTEITMLKKQGMQKLQEKGYKSLADAHKIDEEIKEIEEEILKEIPKMREYIVYVGEQKELMEKILMS